MLEKEIDLEAVKMFYDPHPGMMGASAPIPVAVRVIAYELNGKTLPLREAVEKIKAVTNGEVKIYQDCILLHSGTFGGVGHIWRVIKFKD